ncbi:integral membrane protein [Dactylonectria estremocensis]|uniref:Integral membrane protein n=1 Tax=Dactylonectria estremocensis TaxID=1079267 RepID=A0A9P9EBB7_9HYPO|nr:integral membrane protein [Dactylonectria estremocensis]
MGLNSWLHRKTETLSRSWYLSNTAIQYYSACCGAASVIFFVVSFAIADFIPPPKPSWGAEQVAKFYQDHTTRIHAGAAINMIAGGFYLPFSTAISYQIRRVPNMPYIIHQVQLASASAGIWTFMLPGIVLAIASYRPDRPVEITYALNDFFWLVAFMPWPTFMVQNFAFAYAIIIDTRKKPLFPKELAIVNILMPILFSLATGMHTVYSGPFAWDGVITFYLIGFTFLVQVCVDSICLALAAREEERNEDMEKNARLNGVVEASSV